MSGHGYPPSAPYYENYQVNQQPLQGNQQPQYSQYSYQLPQQNQQPPGSGYIDHSNGFVPSQENYQGVPLSPNQQHYPHPGPPYGNPATHYQHPQEFQPQYQQVVHSRGHQYQAQVQAEVQPPPQYYSPSPAPFPQAPPLPPPAPEPVPGTVDPALLANPTSKPISVKLKILRPASSDNMSHRRGSHSVVKMEEQVTATGRPKRNASTAAMQNMASYAEDDEDDYEEDANGEDDDEIPVAGVNRRSSRHNAGKAATKYEEDEFEDRMAHTSPLQQEEYSNTRGRRSRRVIQDPDDEDDEVPQPVVQPRRNAFPPRATRASAAHANGDTPEPSSQSRRKAKSRHSSADAESFDPEASDSETEDDEASDDPMRDNFGTEASDDDFISYDDEPQRRRPKRKTKPRAMPTRRSTRASARREPDSDDEYGASTKRQLRERKSEVNYQLPPLDISAELRQDVIAGVAGPSRRRGVGFANGTRFGAEAGSKGLPWSVTGRNLAHAMGDPDTSDSDIDALTPMKPDGNTGGLAALGSAPGKNAGPSDVPNFGRINPKSNMADADPLGVDMNVTFDDVGGLDGHINQLKEMVALPLLYPELFQQFGITPPRGVLFHGPPGTGKTLLARALAASCSTGNTKISFFMRKGADVLSKWVGEAERQLRMLFEEARAAQPSIIFFDEIDGLAPVRSSKQDQIHASLVSTLLALMDGMDGRGQVIVIGATNRPDAVDSALRRPGRFDREFYFPLPNREARRKIIQINTRKWSPPLADEMLDQLAVLTKGYGGADLRALCTEAALNAIQRRYPQIYRTTDRLLLDPNSIEVGAKDFMMSVKKITPSSARSTASAAAQIPSHLVPLLSTSLDTLREAVDRVLPRHKLPTALEEADFVDDVGNDLEKHMLVQSLDKMRTFRPRILLHGRSGMGQGYLGPAILHHLEGFHVQSLDLGSLMADSTRTIEASLVQLFVEAKRHQPSILFIPSLVSWCAALSDSARTTFKALLDGVPSSDPVLLLAISEGPIDELDGDIRSWFGVGKEGFVELQKTYQDQRGDFFKSLADVIRRPPTEFPDALPRQKRVLEMLPPAPPLPPRQATEAELQREIELDQSARNMMTFSFANILQDFLKKYRKVTSTIKEDALELTYQLQAMQNVGEAAPVPAPASISGEVTEITALPVEPALATEAALPNGHSLPEESAEILMPSASAPAAMSSTTAIPTTDETAETVPKPPVWQGHDIDIETINRKLVRNKYYTPADVLADVDKIVENSNRVGNAEHQTKVAEMAAHLRLHVEGFDVKWIPQFERYKERMLQRKAERAKAKAQNATDKSADRDEATTGTTAPENTEVLAVANSSSKRSREEDTAGERDGKRLREDAMEVDGEAARPTESATDPVDVVHNGESSAPKHFATVPEPQAPPPPSYPPFVLPEDKLNQLLLTLVQKTDLLTVDELEQLRAGCYDRIWRRKSDWDRTAAVEECIKWVEEFLAEVRARRMAEERESL